tara:strand:+ start:875 stop:1297 length:423 start_codon:yes stop_codon:yes gene_type:complete
MINSLVKYLLPSYPKLDKKTAIKINSECTYSSIDHINKSPGFVKFSFIVFSFIILFLLKLYNIILYTSKLPKEKKFSDFEKRIIVKIPFLSKILNSLRAIVLLNWYDNEIIRLKIGASSLESRKSKMIKRRNQKLAIGKK